MNFLNRRGIFYFTWISIAAAKFTFPFLSDQKYIFLDDSSIENLDLETSNLSLLFNLKMKNKIKKICVKESLKMLHRIKSNDLQKRANIVSNILKCTLDSMGTLGSEILSELKALYNVEDTI